MLEQETLPPPALFHILRQSPFSFPLYFLNISSFVSFLHCSKFNCTRLEILSSRSTPSKLFLSVIFSICDGCVFGRNASSYPHHYFYYSHWLLFEGKFVTCSRHYGRFRSEHLTIDRARRNSTNTEVSSAYSNASKLLADLLLDYDIRLRPGFGGKVFCQNGAKGTFVRKGWLKQAADTRRERSFCGWDKGEAFAQIVPRLIH